MFMIWFISCIVIGAVLLFLAGLTGHEIDADEVGPTILCIMLWPVLLLFGGFVLVLMVPYLIGKKLRKKVND